MAPGSTPLATRIGHPRHSLPAHLQTNRRSLKAQSSSGRYGPSPAWKEALKKECLEKARQKRRDIISRARGRRSNPLGNRAGESAVTGGCVASSEVVRENQSVFSSPASASANGANAEARRLVEAELIASNIGVVPSSPPEDDSFLHHNFAFDQKSTGTSTPSSIVGSNGVISSFTPAAAMPKVPVSLSTPSPGSGVVNQQLVFHTPPLHQVSWNPPQEHCISEEEVFLLMKEVEEELQREEALLVEELKEVEKRRLKEECMMQEQIADYERWVEGGSMKMSHEATRMVGSLVNPGCVADTAATAVPCPVCQKANLIQTNANVILCPNSHRAPGRGDNFPSSSICNFRLDLNGEGLTLDHLRKALADAYGSHSATGCSGRVAFELRDMFGVRTLHAGCSSCSSDVVIL